jgi:hypothetical protein
MCESVHYVHGKYYLRTGMKVSDALGEKAWILGKTKLDLSSLTIVHHNLHWQTLKYVKYGEPIKGMDKYKGIEDATAACIKSPTCTAVYSDFHAHKYYLMTGTTKVPHTTSRVISSIKRLPCGDGKCQGVKSGKVVTIDLKHCYQIKTIEIYNKQSCCSKSGGNVVVKVGKSTCNTVYMSGKTATVRFDCATNTQGKAITMTFNDIGDIDIEGIFLHFKGVQECD